MNPNNNAIIITAGHNNKDPGAVNGLLTEAHVVTDFRNIVAHYLHQAEALFLTDGQGNVNLPLREAIELAKGSLIAVEFHCNAFTNPSATGVETLSQPKDYELGKKLCAAVSDALGIVNRGAKGEGSGQHSRLGFVQAGGIILELFFLSNPNDLKAYLDSKWIAARLVANVLMEESYARRTARILEK